MEDFNVKQFLPIFFSIVAIGLFSFMLYAEDSFQRDLLVYQAPRFSLVPTYKAAFSTQVTATNSTLSTTRPTNNSYEVNHDIRKKVSTKLKQWQIIQVYKKGIDPDDFDYVKNDTLLLRQNKTEVLANHRTCAVVGNSGVLSGSNCGVSIDNHDFIFRMNLAPFGEKFGKDVGYKANITTLNFSQLQSMGRCAKRGFKKMPESCDSMLRNLQLYNHSVIWYPKSSSTKGNMIVIARAMLNEFIFDARWAYSPVSLMGAIPRIWKYRIPSTGLLILSAASMFCEKITMYGFYPFHVDSRNRTLMYHYYDKASMKNPHKMPREFQLYLRLVKEGAVELQQDPCQ